ncbi:hypothetical protein GCM10022277_28910 [Litoribacillus peritrichatus]|uniref:Uncharacterized protein n=1 Tax=Litoribacillus peritrichatus TaxID=718191 RepID=A0ABP7MUW9_9GAMM
MLTGCSLEITKNWFVIINSKNAKKTALAAQSDSDDKTELMVSAKAIFKKLSNG